MLRVDSRSGNLLPEGAICPLPTYIPNSIISRNRISSWNRIPLIPAVHCGVIDVSTQ